MEMPAKATCKFHPHRNFVTPSEYQICLWCATELATKRWACVDCRPLIKKDLHTQEVIAYSLDGQILTDRSCPLPGSLSLREIRYAVSPLLRTHACELIKILPLIAPDYPFDLSFPDDLPIRVLGPQVHVFLSGSTRLRHESLMSKEQATRLHVAIAFALSSIRNEPFAHFRNLMVESMSQLRL